MKFPFKYQTVLICIGIFIFAFWLGEYAEDNELIKRFIASYGYVGIFIIAIISGFNLAVPVPAISFLPLFLGAGLNIWITIVLITLGVTLADMIAFLLGRAGRYVIKEGKMIKRLERMRDKNPHFPIFFVFLFASFVPLPNEVLGLPMGFMGYNRWAVFCAFLFGNFVFNTLYGFGVVNLFNFIQ